MIFNCLCVNDLLIVGKIDLSLNEEIIQRYLGRILQSRAGESLQIQDRLTS